MIYQAFITALLLSSVTPFSSGPVSLQNFRAPFHLPGTELPLDGYLQTLPKERVYLYMFEFLQCSPTFSEFWHLSIKTPRSGAQTNWNSLSDNACLVVRSFTSLINDDGWFRLRCPWVTEETYRHFAKAAKSIYEDPTRSDLFYLMMYARDFGWAKTGQGQFHQKNGQPILEKILTEMQKDPKMLTEWIADHSMPAEIFLGEVSKKGVEELIAKYQDNLSMVGLLSLLELNCLTLDKSAVRQANSEIIAQLIVPEKHCELLSNFVEKRLERLAAAEMLLSKVSKEKQQEVARRTENRLTIMKNVLSSYSLETQQKIARFLEEIELHYIAATFPKMSPQAIMRILKVSAEHCFPSADSPAVHRHVINMRQDLAAAWDKALQTEIDESIEALLSINADNWLIWTPVESAQ